jgi:N-acetylglutamate synthase-like GNAT family acetyltransferase
MIRPCETRDFDSIWSIVNDGARAYKGIIPADRWHEPYMSREELQHELDAGVIFWAFESDGELTGVMGLQPVQDVILVRHAYVRTTSQKSGIGAQLLSHIRAQTEAPILIGTWADAMWAIRFYEKHGFRTVTAEQKVLLLKKYWTVPDRQIETSVVLADPRWYASRPSA